MADEITAAINSNPALRIELQMIRPPSAEQGKAYFVAELPNPWDPTHAVVLSIPDELWAMLGRRSTVVARLSIEDEG